MTGPLTHVRLWRWLHPAPRPHHAGVIMDGNRRWARSIGLTNLSVGHRAGAEHVEDVLRWAEQRDVAAVTLFVLSADKIRKRPGAEIAYLLELLAELVPDAVTRSRQWALHVSGDPRL